MTNLLKEEADLAEDKPVLLWVEAGITFRGPFSGYP
jgi:hypothetical protein